MTPLDLVFKRLNSLKLVRLKPDEYENILLHDFANGPRWDNQHPANLFYTFANFHAMPFAERIYCLLTTHDIYMRRIIHCKMPLDKFGGGSYLITSKNNEHVDFKLLNTDFENNKPTNVFYTIAVLYEIESKDYPWPTIFEIADISLDINQNLCLINRLKTIIPDLLVHKSLGCGFDPVTYYRDAKTVKLSIDENVYNKINDETYKCKDEPKLIFSLK